MQLAQRSIDGYQPSARTLVLLVVDAPTAHWNAVIATLFLLFVTLAGGWRAWFLAAIALPFVAIFYVIMALFVLHRPIEVLAIEHDALVFIGRHPFKRKLVRVPFREIARVVQGHEYGYGHRLRIELASGRHHKLLFFARSQLKRRPYSELINRTEIRFPSSADGADFASKVSELLTALGVEAGSDPLPSFHRVRLARPRGE